MNIRAMNMFLSEDNVKRHLEHLRTHKLRLSILEKSFPEIKGKNIGEIYHSGIEREAKNEALRLSWYIKSHECFFDSFSEAPQKSESIIKSYTSREKFVYEIYLEAMKRDYGFIYIYRDKKIPKIIFSKEEPLVLLKIKPELCIDLYEHTYFSDYGFCKDRFVRSALMYLDTGKLN